MQGITKREPGPAKLAARAAAGAAKAAVAARAATGAAKAAIAAKVAAGRPASGLSWPASSRIKIIQKLLPADFTLRDESFQEDFNQILGRWQLHFLNPILYTVLLHNHAQTLNIYREK
jgi:hypothetical protein